MIEDKKKYNLFIFHYCFWRRASARLFVQRCLLLIVYWVIVAPFSGVIPHPDAESPDKG